jgi:hypothetical protein
MKTTTANKIKTPPMTRTVKISDVLHKELRIFSVTNSVPMQDWVEALLTFGMKNRKEVYNKHFSAAERAAA